MKEKYVAAVLFPALTHCVLPHITASHSHLSHSGSNSPLFLKQLGRLLHLSAGR